MSPETIFIIFLFLKYHYKKLYFQIYPTKTCKNKNNYYHNFKIQIGVDLEQISDN